MAGTTSFVITICIIGLSVMPLLSARSSASHHRTSMEPPHSQFPPRRLGPLEEFMPIARDGSSMPEAEEEWRKDIVDLTGDRNASQGKKKAMTGRRMTTATVHRQAGNDNERRGTRMMREEESSRNNNNPHSRRYYNKYYFPMDYSGLRRRRPIHNKSIPSSSAITPP